MASKASFLAVFVGLSCALLTGCVRDAVKANAPVQASCTTDTKESKGAWERFRASHPLHIQGVALSSPFGEGCRTLVIAEPPPQVTLKGLVGVAPELLAHHRVEQHVVGYDGWTKDVVVTLPPVEAAELDELVAELHEHLFDTTYKSYTLDIPAKAKAAPTKTVDLDVRVTHEELEKWISSGDLYRAVEGGEASTLEDLLVVPRPGVYLGASPGLVAWALPRHGRFDRNLVEARQFVLDSDLVVGAVASDETVLILGRERLAPLDVLPPLRVETLLLLASVDTEELRQSFEMRRFFAGRQEDRWDLHVIELSDELYDTEYGSLLNITDQVIKLWSNNGEVRAWNFPQPDPPRWAFDEPLSVKFGSKGMIYNWNTTGFGVTVDLGSREILAFRGTASLPVKYIPNVEREGVDRFEERGYEFFASQSDPNLVRVAQYTALYQTFQAFGVRAGQKPAKAPRAAQEAVLERAALDTLQKIRDAEPEQLDAAMSKLVPLLSTLYGPKSGESIDPEHGRYLLGEVQRFLRDLTHDELLRVATRLALPSVAVDAGVTELQTKWVDWLNRNRWPVVLFADRSAIKDAYVKAAQPREGTWIHTPSVALSKRSRDWAELEGGHNIDSWVGKIVTNPYYRGDPVIVPGPGGQKLGRGYINPKDLGKIKLDPTASPNAAARTTTAALKRPLQEDGTTRGAPRSKNNGWEPASIADVKIPPASKDGEAVILVSYGKDGYRITSSEGHAMRAKTSADARDAALRIKRRAEGEYKSARVILDGFPSPDEARGFSNALKLRSKSDDIMVARGSKSSGQWGSERFDFKKTVVTEGPSTNGRAELRFAAVSKGGETKAFTFRAWTKKATSLPAKWFGTVKKLFGNVLEKVGLRKGGATIDDVVKAMRKELKVHQSELGDVDFEIVNEIGDALIVRLDPQGQKKANDG